MGPFVTLIRQYSKNGEHCQGPTRCVNAIIKETWIDQRPIRTETQAEQFAIIIVKIKGTDIATGFRRRRVLVPPIECKIVTEHGEGQHRQNQGTNIITLKGQGQFLTWVQDADRNDWRALVPSNRNASHGWIDEHGRTGEGREFGRVKIYLHIDHHLFRCLVVRSHLSL